MTKTTRYTATTPLSMIALDRRRFLYGSAGALAAGPFAGLATPAIAQGAALKIGFMLPYSGTFAKLGQYIDAGFRLYVEKNGGMLGGRKIEFVQVDDES